MRFVEKISSKSSEKPEEDKEGSKNVKLHTRRTLWLLTRTSVPIDLRKARTSSSSVGEWKDCLEKNWNFRPTCESLLSRPMSRATLGGELPLWLARTLTGEHRRFLVKFLVGKFPIPKNGVRIPRDVIKELAVLAGKSNRWTQAEEKRTVELIESVRRHIWIFNNAVLPVEGDPH